MREVNFSIPNVNKASVNITTTLYDRRALDCTSTLPLINSLNHLAYLTTSSARIRDILTIDGGIERLVCILKEGRSNDLMEMWKWSLAFQCVVNIGVRGSESVRTRVVEADMVPVIATILDNYISVFDKMRARSEPEPPRLTSRQPKPFSLTTRDAAGSSGPSGSGSAEGPSNAESRPSRRQPPPPNIEIPRGLTHDRHANADANNMMDLTSSPRMPMTSPPERGSFSHDAHHLRSNNVRQLTTGQRLRTMQPLATAVPPMDSVDGFGLRPVRDTERLPSMLPSLQAGVASQPDSPTTPNGPAQLRNLAQLAPLRRQRPAIRQQLSGSGDSDDANGEDAAMADDGLSGDATEPIVGVQNRMEIDDVVAERQGMLDDGTDAHGLTMTDPTNGQEAETFNITHRSPVDGSVLNNTATPNAAAFGLSPTQTTDTTNPAATLGPSPYSLYLRDRSTTTAQGGPSVMPRDEDVLMSLQLLAYVSKYCNLRSYFQHTHLVPKLKLDRELRGTGDASGAGAGSPVNPAEDDDEGDDEYLLADDVNIFPLVEKFTVRHHSKDMQYWACVVMRNLCRKDESRGGIRQCAYYKCGKWEEFQRQFAKCRRCRRTKYCSKDCQKAAWVYHRHWCHTTP